MPVNAFMSNFEHPSTFLTDHSFFFITTLGVAALVTTVQQHRKKQQLQQVREQNRLLFQQAFEHSHQYIGLLDNRGHLMWSNAAFQRLFLPRSTRSMLPMWRWIEWVQGKEIEQQIKRLELNKISRFEITLLNEYQNIVYLDVALQYLPADGDNPPQLLFEAGDVTQRQLAQQQLQSSEGQYRQLYEQQPVMLLTIDRNSRIQSVNQCTTEWLGYQKDELLGHKVTDFYLKSSPSPCTLINPKEKEDFAIFKREIAYRCRGGRVRWIRERVRSTQEKSVLLLVGEDISDAKRMEEQLRYQAQHDFLTGLYNRNHFEICLQQALDEANEQSVEHAMYYLDLDQFRVINDTLGHEAGDSALKKIGKLLTRILPSDALIARLGGDEFAIICYQCNEAQAMAIAKNILNQLVEYDCYWENRQIKLGCSIGIRMLDCTATSAQQIHAQADTACYVAKQDGRSRIHLYRSEDQELKRHEREMAFVNKIYTALAEDRFDVFAQQIVSIASPPQHLYFEALVRMRDEKGNYVSPGHFIPAAERFNIAHLIDRKVIEKCLNWFRSHPQAIPYMEKISINISGRSMSDSNFVRFLLKSLQESVLPCSSICLEITETAAIGNLSDANKLFMQLKQLGCLIALDDFGAGLSSFGYLKTLPVDIIKIDGLFVKGIADDHSDYVMVDTIHQLAQQMGKITIAEFVENEAILSKLAELGVDYAQGYHYGMPKPMASLITEFMNKQSQLQSHTNVAETCLN